MLGLSLFLGSTGAAPRSPRPRFGLWVLKGDAMARQPKVAGHFQRSGQTVFVGAWREDEDFPIHPKGSQPKRTIVAPDSCPYPFLIPGHTYMFKTAKKAWQANQLWSEVVAYRLGCLCGVAVPPSFAAIDDATGEAGVLMEFFYGYADEPVTPRLVHGGDLLERVISDRKRGRPHGVRPNVTLCRRLGIRDAAEWWGRTLVFDALIANVDRHPDNWGIMYALGEDVEIEMTPLFDNGTSLGYGLTEEALAELNDPAAVERYSSRGNHHCGWNFADDGPSPYVDLCDKFAIAYPEAIAAMRNVIRFDSGALAGILDDLTKFGGPIPFTENRARFVAALVERRRVELSEALRVRL